MKKILILSVLAAIIFTACEPINKRDELPAPLTEQQIKEQVIIDVRATEPGGNQIVLENKSNFGGRWVLPTGDISTRKVDTVVLFPPGDYNVRFEATTDNGIAVVEKPIKIERLSVALTPPYSYLIGEYGNGVNWVYAKDHPSGAYWGMVADYNWQEFWWFPNYTGESFNNKFTFTYDNGFTFILDGVRGSFKLDPAKMTLTLQDPFMHLYDTGDYGGIPLDVAQEGLFYIKKLNANEMTLLQKYPDGYGYDWIWNLKREGYSY